MPGANRSLLPELLAADFEWCLDGAIGRVRERVPSREHLKQHGLIKKDRTDHRMALNASEPKHTTVCTL